MTRRMLQRDRGFTLIELMIVVVLIAIASSVATLAMRDPASTRLEREGARLAALLESARAESRSLGSAVVWLPTPYSNADQQGDFRFVGLPEKLKPKERWLDPDVTAEVPGATAAAPGVVLGPEPILKPQRIVLHLDGQRIVLATDGMSPFDVSLEEGAEAGNGQR